MTRTMRQMLTIASMAFLPFAAAYPLTIDGNIGLFTGEAIGGTSQGTGYAGLIDAALSK